MKLQSFLSTKLTSYYERIQYFAELSIRDSVNPENLHQFRVFCRRAEAIVREFKECFDSFYRHRVLQRLKSFLHLSTRARDLDVLLEHLYSSCSSRELINLIERQRAKAYQEIKGELAAVGAYLYGIKEPKIECSKKLKKTLRKHFKKRLRALKIQGDLHKLRIRLKRVRYVAELMVEVGLIGKKRLKKLKKLQDILGQIHDASVQIAYLKSLTTTPLPPDILEAIAKVVAEYRKTQKRLTKSLQSQGLF